MEIVQFRARYIVICTLYNLLLHTIASAYYYIGIYFKHYCKRFFEDDKRNLVNLSEL